MIGLKVKLTKMYKDNEEEVKEVEFGSLYLSLYKPFLGDELTELVEDFLAKPRRPKDCSTCAMKCHWLNGIPADVCCISCLPNRVTPLGGYKYPCWRECK